MEHIMIQEAFRRIQEILGEVLSTQIGAMQLASEKIAEAIERRSNVYAFGCNHAGILAQEMVYRTGGLAVVNLLTGPGLALDLRPITMTTAMERLENYGRILADGAGIRPGDVVLVSSVSGRNAVSLDVALHARELGAYTIALTNVKSSQSEASRHSSGKHLFEVCDLTIDNCGDVGDAMVYVEKLGRRVAASSTAVGAAIVNAIVAGAVEILVNKNISPPVFLSSNVEGGDAYNASVLQEYKDNIQYM